MIPTDGSEERVGIGESQPDGTFAVHPQASKAISSYIHDDFSAYQQGRKATTQQNASVLRLRRTAPQT
jgi:hypothetical protein